VSEELRTLSGFIDKNTFDELKKLLLLAKRSNFSAASGGIQYHCLGAPK
jgi:hypothetical protein